MFILPEGSHSLYAKIINKKTGLEEKSCQLKYKVIIRQCQPYRLRNRQLKVKCDLGTIWGSKCTFSCRNPAAVLSHMNPAVCDDNLEWFGEEPTCRTHNYNKKNKYFD